MSFLTCKPTVFVVENDYEILINTREFGICAVKIGNTTVYDTCAGVRRSERLYHKIRIPQKQLDQCGEYQILFHRSINRKNYFSEFGEEEGEIFAFKPLTKKEDINIYHLADVHRFFLQGIACASYFGEKLDLLIINGDLNEYNTEEDFFKTANFIGEIAQGRIPVLFVRGNHDARGRLAERFVDYFPVVNGATYFTFSLGVLKGIVLDSGEDKADSDKEYNGTTQFEPYRREEYDFLKRVSISTEKDDILFAVCHNPLQRVPRTDNPRFNIESELYARWIDELERLGIRFMLSGHVHYTAVFEKNDSRTGVKYPLVVGSQLIKPEGEDYQLLGAAITVHSKRLEIRFTDKNKMVREAVKTNI